MSLSKARRFALVISIGSLFQAFVQSAHAADPLIVGQTLSLSGPNSGIGAALAEGRQACTDHVNARGGLGGRPIKLVTLDDGGSPRRAADNVRLLLDRDKATALLGPMGAEVAQAVLPAAVSAGAVVFAPFGSDVGSRGANLNGVFFVTANQSVEAERLAMHVAALKLDRIAVVHSLDAGGRAALVALEEGLTGVGLHPVMSIGVQADGSDARRAAEATQGKAKAVLLATTGRATTEVLRVLAELGAGQGLLQVYGLSSSASSSDLAQLGKSARGFSMVQVLPSPADRRLPLAATFRAALSGTSNSASYVQMEGCLGVLAFAEALKRKPAELTKTSIWKAMRDAGIVNVGGYQIDFSDRMKGSTYTDIVFIGTDGKAVR